MSSKLCMEHDGLKLYKVHVNDGPRLTLMDFTARSDLVSYFLYEENFKKYMY